MTFLDHLQEEMRAFAFIIDNHQQVEVVELDSGFAEALKPYSKRVQRGEYTVTNEDLFKVTCKDLLKGIPVFFDHAVEDRYINMQFEKPIQKQLRFRQILISISNCFYMPAERFKYKASIDNGFKFTDIFTSKETELCVIKRTQYNIFDKYERILDRFLPYSFRTDFIQELVKYNIGKYLNQKEINTILSENILSINMDGDEHDFIKSHFIKHGDFIYRINILNNRIKSNFIPDFQIYSMNNNEVVEEFDIEISHEGFELLKMLSY